MRQNIKIIIQICVVIAALFVLGLCQPEPAPDFVIETVPTATPEKYVIFLPIVSKAPPPPFVGFSDAVGIRRNDISSLPDAPFFDWWLGYHKSRWDNPNYYRMIGFTNTSVIADDGIRYTIEDMAAYDYAHDMNRKWLIFNEPDMVGQAGDVLYHRPEYAAQFFSEVHDRITEHDPTATFFVGGLVWLNTNDSRQWWRRFVAELDRLGARHKVDGQHIHLYPKISIATKRDFNVSDDVDCFWCVPELKWIAGKWKREMHDPYFPGKPIIITEIGWLIWCDNQQQTWNNFTSPMLNWFNNQNDFDGMFLFVTNTSSYNGTEYNCTWLIDDNGNLTYLGQKYKQFIEAR